MGAAPKALERRLVYACHWLNLYVDKVLFPNGWLIEEHHLVDVARSAVLTVATHADGRFLMVQVCRYTTGVTEWEFPAGSVEADEDILEAAQREVLEETGFEAANLRLLYTYHPFHGMSNAVFHIAACQVQEQAAPYDVQEISAVRWFTEEQIWDMIHSGSMKDGFTLTAFLLWNRLHTGSM
jgi:ADP-ribose pyrophosphatase